MNTTTVPPNGSQQHHGPCLFCRGSGLIASKTGKNPTTCPKCGGTGKAAKVTTK